MLNGFLIKTNQSQRLQKPLYEYDKKHGLLEDGELEEANDDSDSDEDIEEDEEDDKKIFNEMNKRKQKIYHDIEVEKKQKPKKAKKPKKPAKSKSKNKQPKSKEPQIKKELDKAPRVEGRLLRSAKVKQNPKQQQHQDDAYLAQLLQADANRQAKVKQVKKEPPQTRARAKK